MGKALPRQSREAAPPRTAARERILDAAEALFADFGYHGTSIRAVAQAAEVDSFRTHYYFGSKEELFRQVLTRREDEFLGALSESLDATLAGNAGGAIALEALIEAWIRPGLTLIMGAEDKWKHYFRLHYRIGNTSEHQFATLMRDRYQPVYTRYIEAFTAALPAARQDTIQWAFHFIEQIYVGVLNEDHQASDHPPWRLRMTSVDEALRRMIPFYTAGFQALASRDYVVK
jgi:AcrR family transcriptional regulator